MIFSRYYDVTNGISYYKSYYYTLNDLHYIILIIFQYIEDKSHINAVTIDYSIMAKDFYERTLVYLSTKAAGPKTKVCNKLSCKIAMIYNRFLWLGTFARLTNVYSYSMDGSIRKKCSSFSIWLKSLQRYLRPISITITKPWCIQIWYPTEKLISEILFARKILFMSSLLRFANPYWSLLWVARMKYQTNQLN